MVKHLVLVGGGHSHAIVLKMFGMQPLAGMRLTLITEASDTPYSGMLPGHVAGFYSHEECHIDLQPLCQFAQARLLIDQVIGLDLKNNKVICANQPPVAFDFLSINIGSTPAISLPEVSQYATPVKPVRKFLTDWEQLLKQEIQTPQKPLCLSIVGGGAGGVELAMSMHTRLQQVGKNLQAAVPLQLHLFHRDVELMPHYNRWVRRRVQEILSQRGVQLHLGETVSKVAPYQVKCESGLRVECDRIFWVTQASAPPWLQAAGLATDSKGFIWINDTLQSVSHPHIFAAGDVATMVNHPRPKAGVFAVRQGKPLFHNLQQALRGKPLKAYIPQKRYLSLIGTGDRAAIAAWGIFGWESPLFWYWKDYIDRQFMAQFSNLPQRPETADPTPRHTLKAAAAKVATDRTEET